MKKSLAKKITLCILAGAVLMSSSVVWAKPKPPGDSSSMVEKWERLYAGEFLRNELKNPNGQDLDYVKEYYSYEENIDEEFEEACFYGSILPNSDSEEASGGKVTLDEDDVTVYSIIGGYARYDNEVTLVLKNNGVAESNTVTISNGEVVYSAIGGRGYTASSNTVNISGGKIGSDASPVLVVGGFAEGGNANSNTVNISGGTFTGEVCGGYSTIIGVANNNTVNISGVAILENAGLFGGAKVSKGSSEGVYGGADAPNTLNIGVDDELKSQLATKGITVDVGAWNNKKVKSIAGFDVINFNYINWSHEGNVVETDTLELNNTKVGKVVIGSGTVKNSESMNLISVTGTRTGEIIAQPDRDITIRTGLTTSETVKGDIVLDGNNIKLTIDDTSIGADGIVASGTSSSTNVPTGATSLVDAIDKVGEETVAYKVLDAVYTNYTTDEEQKKAATNMLQLGEAGGQSATAANISRNVSGATVNRMSFGGRGGVRHRGGHGPADFNEKDGSAVWAQYVHGKDKVDGMALADGVTTSYESQFNGVVLGVDFKEVGKYQSGIAFNYGEGDSHTKNIAFSRSDYDFWGIGYYGAVKNADSNVIFDINYAKTDSEVKQQFRGGVELEAEPETTTISAGVKIEKLIDRGAMQFVPYAGLRFMSIDTDEYSANYLGKEAFNYSADRQNIWLLPVGVGFCQENVYDSGWVVTPKVDLSYIWAFGDTENEMTVRTPDVTEAARLGYTVMNDGSFLGSIGLEAEKGDWTFGVAYSYQKSSDSRSDRWYVDAKYSF